MLVGREATPPGSEKNRRRYRWNRLRDLRLKGSNIAFDLFDAQRLNVTSNDREIGDTFF
jgi:hypothetical protein